MGAADRMADKYALTHKINFSAKSKQSFSKGNVNSKQKIMKVKRPPVPAQTSHSPMEISPKTTHLDLLTVNTATIVRKKVT